MTVTALDTNIVSALWSREENSSAVALRLDQVMGEGRVIMSAPVYAELMACPGMSVSTLDEFVESMRIKVDFDLDEAVWRKAGESYAGYVKRRRRSGGGEPKGLLVDFIVGAHAELLADRLLTEDVSRYRTSFPGLPLLTVTQ